MATITPKRVLALDISTKTGWALGVSGPEGLELIAYGQIPAIHEPIGKYPGTYVDWSLKVFETILELFEEHHPDVLSIEETVAGSKSVFSQKILEYIHYNVAKLIRDTGIEARYFLTGEWRSIVGCSMTKEEKLRNKLVKAHNNKLEASGATKKTRARDKDGKAIGKISKKHVNIRKANEIFGKYLQKPLKKQDEDLADALCLLASWHMKNFNSKI